MKTNCVSIEKFEPGCINEDAVLARDNVIAVSDGAGGGGLFAERWSRYLLDHLPDTPICSAEELDRWIEQIWEPFYNQCETDAKLLGGMSLEKFYDEGSFATLVAVWRTSGTTCRWMSFGDSVAFCYDFETHKLIHTFGSLSDFDNPPYLINCKDEINGKGFKSGEWNVSDNSIVFAASDSLAHYILMMYEVSRKGAYAKELQEAAAHHSKNENYIRMAQALPTVDFEKKVLRRLLNCASHPANLKRHLEGLLRKGLLTIDDYSFAVLVINKDNPLAELNLRISNSYNGLL